MHILRSALFALVSVWLPRSIAVTKVETIVLIWKENGGGGPERTETFGSSILKLNVINRA